MTEVISFLNLVAMAPGGDAEGGGMQIFIMIGGMMIFFYFLMYRPEKKKREERQKTLDALERGTEVITAGGMYGRITAMTDKTITLEVANNVKLKFSRQHITGPVAKEEAQTGSKKKK